MEENLFANVEYSPVKHAGLAGLGWTDISGPGPASFLSRSSMCYIMLTLHNPINPLNVVSANSFS